MGLADKVETVLWFFRRPQELTSLPHFLLCRYLGQPSHSKASRKWCEARVTWPDDAIRLLTGHGLDQLGLDAVARQAGLEKIKSHPRHDFEQNYFAIEEAFPEVFVEAQRVVAATPVDMGGPAILDLLYFLTRHKRAERVLETGVGYGWSALAILLGLKESKNPCLISTDREPDSGDGAYVGCVVPADLRPRWRFIREADWVALPKILAEWPQIDLVHYDSDKSYDGRMWASRQIWKALSPGGFIVYDDICDNYAYRDFCVEVRQTPLVVGYGKNSGKYAGVLVKPME